jgi:hypothetical protein
MIADTGVGDTERHPVCHRCLERDGDGAFRGSGGQQGARPDEDVGSRRVTEIVRALQILPPIRGHLQGWIEQNNQIDNADKGSLKNELTLTRAGMPEAVDDAAIVVVREKAHSIGR